MLPGPPAIAWRPSTLRRSGGTLLAPRGGMLTMLTAPALTFVFLAVVIGLGAALVWAFWEIEQVSKSQRSDDRLR